nr:cation/calcium exchanger 5 [Tanacetum cinerariifolium]
MSSAFADTHNMVAILTKSDASEGFDQIIDFLNGSYIQYALIVNPHIYKKGGDIGAVIREVLRLDDAEGVDCLPNEFFFTGLPHSSSKFCMYPRFIQLIILNQLGDLSTHTTKYISPALTQKVFANMKRIGKGFFGVETPLFEGMLAVREKVEEQSEMSLELLRPTPQVVFSSAGPPPPHQMVLKNANDGARPHRESRFRVFCGVFKYEFYILVITAQNQFSKIVTTLSRHLNLTPSIGAVTLLALGNGAPDVFASLAAVGNGNGRMGFGAILSAGMFVSAVVVGFVAIYSAPFGVDAVAFVRDVLFYMTACLFLFYVYLSGEIWLWQAVGFVGFYLFFVGVVFWMDLGFSNVGKLKRGRSEVSVDGGGYDLEDRKGFMRIDMENESGLNEKKATMSGFQKAFEKVC